MNDEQLHTALLALAVEASIPAAPDAPEFEAACTIAAKIRVTALDGLARRCALRGERQWAVYYRGLCDGYEEILAALTAREPTGQLVSP